MLKHCLCTLALLSFVVGCGSSPSGPVSATPDMGGLGNSECPEPTGAGTTHGGFISSDETWSAAASPHHVTSALDVRGATLTIEACALVRVAEGASITIGENTGAPASLVARGTYDQATTAVRPVAITSEDGIAYWGSLAVLSTGSADLAVVGLDHGGNANGGVGYGGSLVSRGDDNRKLPLRNVRAQIVLIQNSAGFGVNIQTSGGFTEDSDGIIVQGAGSHGVVSGGIDTSYAAYVEAPSIHTLPRGQYTGNTRDEIVLRAPFRLEVDETIHDRGVPYQVVGDFHMSPTAPAPAITLTIDPGARLKFGGPLSTNPSMTLGSGGTPIAQTRLVAQGTAQKPIVLTSGAPAPAAGDWVGVRWYGGPATGNVITNVTIEHGGGFSGSNGFGCGPTDNTALLLIENWQPGEAFITASTFQSSAGGGILCGWNSDVSGPDLKSGNTFSGIANGCAVSVPKSAAGQCPGNDSTPDCY